MIGPRLVLERRLAPQTPTAAWPFRAIAESDVEDLAILLYAAYRGTVDDEGGTFSDALAEIERTYAGGYGRLLPDCSFIIEEGEFLASACIVSWFEHHDAPLVVFAMTRPEAQRRGMARFLLQQSMNALIERGYDRLTLVVTNANAPARTLYESLGFRPHEAES